MTQAMFSQIILENPSGRCHIKDQHRVFHDDGYSQFLLQTFKKIFLWLNNRNIWLVYFLKQKGTLNTRIVQGTTDFFFFGTTDLNLLTHPQPVLFKQILFFPLRREI